MYMTGYSHGVNLDAVAGSIKYLRHVFTTVRVILLHREGLETQIHQCTASVSPDRSAVRLCQYLSGDDG